MKSSMFTKEYSCKYQLKSNPIYQFTNCGKCFNGKSGREVKQVMKGYTIGYIIGGKFQSLARLRTDLELIKKVITPF